MAGLFTSFFTKLRGRRRKRPTLKRRRATGKSRNVKRRTTVNRSRRNSPPLGYKSLSEEEKKLLENTPETKFLDDKVATSEILGKFKTKQQNDESTDAVGEFEIGVHTIPRDEVVEAVKNISTLPTLASLAGNMKQLMASSETSLEDVVEAIERDPTLAEKVIKLVNTAYHRGSEPISNLEQAIFRLGIEPIRRLSTFTRVLNDGQKIAKDFDWQCLWMHNIATGMCTEDLCAVFGIEKTVYINCAGMLHDIGKIILSDIYPEQYFRVIEIATEHTIPLNEIETSIFGMNHQEAGALYGRTQKLPDNIINAIEFHNDPENAEEEHKLDAAIVQVANFLVKSQNLGFSGDLSHTDKQYTDLPGWEIIMSHVEPGLLAYLKSSENYIPLSLKSILMKIREGLGVWFPDPNEKTPKQRRQY